MKSERPQMAPKVFIMRDEDVRKRAIFVLQHLPTDRVRPVQIVFREEPKKRSSDANAALWAGPLRDISEQAYLDGRQFSPEVWAHWFKVQLLPEDFDPALCLEGYCKWSIDPSGDRVLTGSTTQLTVKGHAEYRMAIEAYGASLGVIYHTKEQ